MGYGQRDCCLPDNQKVNVVLERTDQTLRWQVNLPLGSFVAIFLLASAFDYFLFFSCYSLTVKIIL